MTNRPNAIIIATGAVLLAAYLAAMIAMPKPDGRVVFGDATHYFVQLRSLVYDRDVHFQNEYIRLYGLTEYVPGTEWIYSDLTPTGYLRNYMPLGPALLWAPVYLVMTLLQLVASGMGLAARPDGFSWFQQLAPGISGVCAATLASLVTLKTLRARVGDTAALVGVLGTWIGTHAVYYSLVSPNYSHAVSMLTASVFFGSWLTGRAAPSPGRFAGWGALAGLCALMRWQDAIFLLVPAIEAIRWRQPLARRVAALALAGCTFLAVFSPQMAMWHVLYGQPFAIPQGPSFMQWTTPHLFSVLFSDNHGLITWAPLIVVGLAGLWMALREEPAWRLPVAAVLLVSWYVNGAVADWWAGEAFGARRFISLFPLFALGLATWVARRSGRTDSSALSIPRVAVVIVFTGLNWLLLLQYQLYLKGAHDLAAYPTGAFNMWFERFVVPFRLIGRMFG